MGLCLVVTGLALVPLMSETITLSWRHSVEKTLWEEVWQQTPRGLILSEARVSSSGAGMEPGPDARLVDGRYVWTPNLPPQVRVTLRRSEAVADYKLCIRRHCQPLSVFLPIEADPVSLEACR